MKEITFEVYHEYLEQRLKELQRMTEQIVPKEKPRVYLEAMQYMDFIMRQLFDLDSGEESDPMED